MKLAEALVERKAAQTKITELNERLQRMAVVQQGEQPAEAPADLLRELAEVTNRLETLMVAINLTNTTARVADGTTLTAAIARRDVMRMRMGVLDALARTAGSVHQRVRGSEIKLVATVDVAQLQRERNQLAQQYRELDTSIQAANWLVDLNQA